MKNMKAKFTNYRNACRHAKLPIALCIALVSSTAWAEPDTKPADIAGTEEYEYNQYSHFGFGLQYSASYLHYFDETPFNDKLYFMGGLEARFEFNKSILNSSILHFAVGGRWDSPYKEMHHTFGIFELGYGYHFEKADSKLPLEFLIGLGIGYGRTFRVANLQDGKDQIINGPFTIPLRVFAEFRMLPTEHVAPFIRAEFQYLKELSSTNSPVSSEAQGIVPDIQIGLALGIMFGLYPNYYTKIPHNDGQETPGTGTYSASSEESKEIAAKKNAAREANEAYRRCTAVDGVAGYDGRLAYTECAKLIYKISNAFQSIHAELSSITNAEKCYSQYFENIDRARSCRIDNNESWDILRKVDAVTIYASRLNALEKYLPHLTSISNQKIDNLNSQLKQESDYPKPLSDEEEQQLRICYDNKNKLTAKFAANWFYKNHNKKICKNGEFIRDCHYVTILKENGMPMPGNINKKHIYKGYMHVSEIVNLQNAALSDWNSRGKTFPRQCKGIIDIKNSYDQEYQRVTQLNNNIREHNAAINDQINIEKDMIQKYEDNLKQVQNQYTSSINMYCNDITNNWNTFKENQIQLDPLYYKYIKNVEMLNSAKAAGNKYFPNNAEYTSAAHSAEYYKNEYYKKPLDKAYSDVKDVIINQDIALTLCKSPDTRTTISSLQTEADAVSYIRETQPNADRIFLSKDDVKSVVFSEDNEDAIKICMKDSIIKGDVDVKFDIKPTGNVTNAKVLTQEFVGTPTESCILDIVNAMTFKNFVGNDITYTVTFEN